MLVKTFRSCELADDGVRRNVILGLCVVAGRSSGWPIFGLVDNLQTSHLSKVVGDAAASLFRFDDGCHSGFTKEAGVGVTV